MEKMPNMPSMASMTAKEYFEQAFSAEILLEHKRHLLEKYRDRAKRMTASYSKAVVFGTGVRRTMADATDDAVDLERELEADIAKLENLQVEIYRVIQKIPNEMYRMILEGFYLLGESAQDIADVTGLSRSNVYAQKKKALKAAEKVLSELKG